MATSTSDELQNGVTHEEDVESSKEPRSNASNIHPCPICGKTVTAKHLSDHIRRMHINQAADRPLCPHCGKTFSTPRDLARHVTSSHEPKVSRERRIHACAECGMSFRIAGRIPHTRASSPQGRESARLRHLWEDLLAREWTQAARTDARRLTSAPLHRVRETFPGAVRPQASCDHPHG